MSTWRDRVIGAVMQEVEKRDIEPMSEFEEAMKTALKDFTFPLSLYTIERCIAEINEELKRWTTEDANNARIALINVRYKLRSLLPADASTPSPGVPVEVVRQAAEALDQWGHDRDCAVRQWRRSNSVDACPTCDCQIEEDMAALAPYLDGGRVEDDERKPRDPGCQCHWEEGDSPCPIHDAPASVTLSRSGRDEKLAECLRDVAADVPVQVLIDRLCEVQGYLRHGAADSVLLPRSTVEKVRCELEFVLKELRMSGSTLHALYADCVNIALDMLPKEKL